MPNVDNIESLDPREFTRLRPGVYCGDTTYSTQLLIEIISNSVDVWSKSDSVCNKIDIVVNGTKVSVEDNGSGFPINEIRDDGKTTLEASYSVMNTSGKFRADGSYEGTALGLNGIGAKLCCWLSLETEVTSYNSGHQETVYFKDGLFNKRELTSVKKDKHGTIVSWIPDPQFFVHPEVDINRIKDYLKTLSCLCKGLTFELNYNNEITSYQSNNGINDLVDYQVGDKEILKNRFELNFVDGKNKLDMVLTYMSNYSFSIVPYVNTGYTESGPQISQIKTIITREFNKFFKEKKWLKDKDNNLTGDDIQEGMYIAFNLTAPNVAYDAQTKSRIVKIDMTPFTGAIASALQEWLSNNEKEIKAIFDKAAAARKAREAAKKARDAARGQNKKGKKKLLNLPTKLVDANAKDRSRCELLIAEGDSAASGLVEARDPEIHAIFPIRGKIIAAYKNSPEKIFANQEVNNIIKALGLDFDIKSGRLIYDRKKLRYGKILLCADGDPDGESIKNLLLEFFWWICPELIIFGHVYSTLPPLFRITTKNNKYIFLKDQAALDKYKKDHVNEKYLINRNKGLGEQDSEELRQCLIDPSTRNIKQVVVKDIDEANELMECLMGPSVPPRRAYLLAHSEEARGEND